MAAQADESSQQPQQENANQNAIVSASEADNKKQTKRGTVDKQQQPTESQGKQKRKLRKINSVTYT